MNQYPSLAGSDALSAALRSTADHGQLLDLAPEAADEIERLSSLLAGLPMELRLRSKMYLGKRAEGMMDAAAIVEARIKQPNAEVHRKNCHD